MRSLFASDPTQPHFGVAHAEFTLPTIACKVVPIGVDRIWNLPPPLTPPHKGEGGHCSGCADAKTSVIPARTAATASPPPCGERQGGGLKPRQSPYAIAPPKQGRRGLRPVRRSRRAKAEARRSGGGLRLTSNRVWSPASESRAPGRTTGYGRRRNLRPCPEFPPAERFRIVTKSSRVAGTAERSERRAWRKAGIRLCRLA